MKKGLIYGYKKDGKIKYVGQTTNINYRHYRHIKYDPFNSQIKEYNYPLSRGIRKYGQDMYELVILENDINEEQLIEREQYWIEYYDTYNTGYNQTPGGIAPKYIDFDIEVINLAIDLIKNQKSFQEISEITGISIPHLSAINHGKRHHNSQYQYPLSIMTQGRKLTKEQVDTIIEMLTNTYISQDNIAQQFNVSQATIGNINRGKRYKREDLSYPLRTKKRK